MFFVVYLQNEEWKQISLPFSTPRKVFFLHWSPIRILIVKHLRQMILRLSLMLLILTKLVIRILNMLVITIIIHLDGLKSASHSVVNSPNFQFCIIKCTWLKQASLSKLIIHCDVLTNFFAIYTVSLRELAYQLTSNWGSLALWIFAPPRLSSRILGAFSAALQLFKPTFACCVVALLFWSQRDLNCAWELVNLTAKLDSTQHFELILKLKISNKFKQGLLRLMKVLIS